MKCPLSPIMTLGLRIGEVSTLKPFSKQQEGCNVKTNNCYYSFNTEHLTILQTLHRSRGLLPIHYPSTSVEIRSE